MDLYSGRTSIQPKDYYKAWYESRRGVDAKLVNLKYIKQFGEAIQGHLDPTRLDWEEKLREYRYTGGYANFHLMRFSKGLYIDYFPLWGLYKEAPSTEDAFQYFLEQKNDRYGQHTGVFIKERPYTLFLLQMTSTKDLRETLQYIAWATGSKTYTLFKTHPCPGGDTYYEPLWDLAERLGILSEYTVLVDGVRSEEITMNADRVVSCDSGGTFKALIYDIPVCTLRGPSMTTEIVPQLSVGDAILDVKAVDTKAKMKWLNWFYGRVCLDMHKPNYQDAILEKLWKYEKHGMNDMEVHQW